ncbi:MAG: substrate-binding domain-containing protein, partial [Pirellulaceae bacterium]
MSDVILRGAAGLFINPVNWEGVKGSLLQAKRSGVPCIVVDAPARDEDLVVCTVASDNVEAGRLACRALAKVNPDAQVVILHLSTDKTTLGKKGKSGIMKSMATRQE